MKTLFIPAKLKSKINKSKILELSERLPESIAICYSIQYINQAKEIKALLEKTHKITKLIQVLGCSKPFLPKTTQAILLITDGRFHAISLSIETKLPVYILNRNKLELISNKDTETLKKRKKASYVKFLNADKIGILISTKPGQENLKRALELKKKLNDKTSYLFICNNINTNEFENFPQMQSWVNTACPRLDMDEGSVLNVDQIK